MTTTPKVGDMSTELPSAQMALAEAHRLLENGGMRDLASVWIDLAREIREGSTAPEQPADRLTLHDIEGIVCAHGRVVVRQRLKRKGDHQALWWRHADGDPTICDDVQQSTEHLRRNGAERTDEQFWTRDPAETAPEKFVRLANKYAPEQMTKVFEADPDAGERIQRLFADPRPGDDAPQTTPSDLDQTAVLRSRARVSPARPAAVPPPDHGVCVNCGLDVYRLPPLPGEPATYAHDTSGQQVCSGQRTPQGDETFVHTFAWPAPQG